jgi:WD domain, G-beta repeat/Sigma-70, region 4/WD40-like Beta Propeller Repeat
LNRLPDKYRVPVVLCDLEGRTRRDVARQLGIPVGTLSGRLTTARRMLAKRLARHGLGLSAGALTAALARGAASACLSAPLVASTVEVATAMTAGPAAAGGASAKVVALAEGVLRTMLLKKLKTATGVLLAVGVVLAAAGVVVQADRHAKVPGAPKILDLGSGQRGRYIAWSPDGKTLAVVTKYESLIFGRKGSALKLWDVEQGQVKQTVAESVEKGLSFSDVVFSADGKTIACTVSELIRQRNGLMIQVVVKVWDAKTLALKQTLRGSSQITGLALSPDGKLVAAGDPSKKTVTLWNAATGALERTFPTGKTQPWSLVFSPDSKTLVIGGQNDDHSGEVQLWDAQTWTLKHLSKQDDYVNIVAFSLDGRMVASCEGGELVQVWDVEKWQMLASLKGHKHGHRTVVFSPDSKIVAAGGPDGNVRLWDVQTGKVIGTLEGHSDQIYSIAFSPDGKTLASTSQDETVRLWPINHRAAGPK